MRKLTLDNLEDLAIGSAILGAGGGGNPCYPHMSARYRIEQYGPVSLINGSELGPDKIVMPIGFMGTSLVEMEKLPGGSEYKVMFELAEKVLQKKIDAVMPFQIGGGNAFIPIAVAAQLQLPIVDADTIGRAFSGVHRTSCNLAQGCCSPAFATDCLGNSVVVYASGAGMLEKISRQITEAMGSNNAFALPPLTCNEVEKYALPKTVSKAMAMGKVLREAQKKGKDPLDAILTLCKGVYIGSGKIVDVDQRIFSGVLHGTVVIQNTREKIELDLQSEYLVAKVNDTIVATTPDILMLLEQETGTPITTELLQFGLKVNLIALPAPSLWTSPEGLALVGPRQYGYEIDYQTISKINRKTLKD